MILHVCAFVEGELYLSWMQFFQAPFAFILFFICFFFSLFPFSSSFSFYSRANQMTLPWRGDQS
jgi:hypothetical protein